MRNVATFLTNEEARLHSFTNSHVWNSKRIQAEMIDSM